MGLRRAFVGGLAAFAAASLGCALAPGVAWLVVARAAQGIGGAALAVTGFALVAAAYEGPARGRAFGVFFAVSAVGAALGPLLGGALAEGLGWRWVFLAYLPVAAVTIALALLSLPRGGHRTGRVDLLGIAAFGAAAAAATVALTRAGAHGSGDGPTLASAAGGVAALAVFVVVELRDPAGLLDLRLFRRPAFTTAIACAAVWAVAFAALVYTSVWLQGPPALGPFAAGLALLPLALSTAVTSTLAGRLLHGVAPRGVLGVGLLLSGAGCALQSGIDAGSGPLAVTAGLVVTGVGIGVSGPALGAAV